MGRHLRSLVQIGWMPKHVVIVFSDSCPPSLSSPPYPTAFLVSILECYISARRRSTFCLSSFRFLNPIKSFAKTFKPSRCSTLSSLFWLSLPRPLLPLPSWSAMVCIPLWHQECRSRPFPDAIANEDDRVRRPPGQHCPPRRARLCPGHDQRQRRRPSLRHQERLPRQRRKGSVSDGTGRGCGGGKGLYKNDKA